MTSIKKEPKITPNVSLVLHVVSPKGLLSERVYLKFSIR